MTSLRDYQLASIDGVYNALLDGAKAPLIAMPTGCHAAGTMILMFDGSERAVEDVRVGDLLMGPDSRPRRVLALARGREEMFEIVPTKGERFVVNIGHILSLATTNEGKRHKCYQDGTRIDNITVREWLGRSKSWKHLRKLRRAAVDFPPISEPTIDPWFAGVMLGDGSMTTVPTLTNMDNDVIAKCNAYAISIGCRVRVQERPNNKASMYHYPRSRSCSSGTNPLTQLLKDNGLWGNIHIDKHIPHHFKVGSRNTRLQILAGLVDSDGYLDERCTHVDYVTSSRQLAEDIRFVARSVDLAAYVTPCQKGCQNGYVGNYFRVSISGELTILPLVRRHRQPLPRRQKKRHNVTGFAARYVGTGNFYGFSLDGDHLYLTSDFVVHHNTGKSLALAGLVQRTCSEYPQTRHIILSHVREILEQDYEAIKLLWPTAPVGVYSASLRRRDTMHPIIIGGCASVINCVEKFGHRDFAIVDEAHLLGPETESTYQKIIAKLREINPKLVVVGLTATPYRRGIGTLLNNGIFDSMAIDLTDKKSWARFIAEGYLAPLHAKKTEAQIDVRGVKIVNGDYSEKDLQAASDKDELNQAIAKEIWAAAETRNATLVFCAGIEHAEHMAEELRLVGMRAETIHSKMSPKDREKFLEMFKRGDLDALTNNNCLCLDEETEILTSTGFVGIDGMTLDHKIAAWKEDGGIEFTPPELIVRRPRFVGERMVCIGGERGPQIRVTENHRMIVSCGLERRNLEVVPAIALSAEKWWSLPSCGQAAPLDVKVARPHYDRLPQKIAALSHKYRKQGATKEDARLQAETFVNDRKAMSYKNPIDLTLSECELIGFWLGDGTISCGRVALAQSLRYPDIVARVDELLCETGLHAHRHIYPPARGSIHESIRWTLSRGTGGKDQKVIGGWFPLTPYLNKNGTDLFFGLSREQLLALLHGLWLADGNHHCKKRNGTYVVGVQTSLYDILQAACSMRGIRASVRRLSPPRRSHHQQMYSLAWSERTRWHIHGSNTVVETDHIDERVWCVTSSTSYLICRRRGKVFVTGNTTGVNVPSIDLIAMCRATVSVNLWVQMLGRGSRPAPGKSNCLVLDFAGNRPRLGPVDDPYVPKPKGKGEKLGETPAKVCPHCGCYAHISARVCDNCEEKFDIKTKLTDKAGETDIMSTSMPIIKKFPVLRLTCARHMRRADGAAIVRITYMCGGGYFNTWLDFENPRRAHFAREWWRQHVGDDIPQTNDEALALLSGGCAVTPSKVNVWTNKGKYPEILGYEF